MVRVVVTKVFKAPREKVYQKLFDYEKLPGISTIVKSTKIVKREENVQTIEVQGQLLGRRFKTTNRVTFTQPETVVEEIVGGDATGRQEWSLKEVPEGTSVTLVSDITPKGLLGRIFSGLAKGKIEDTIEKEFEALRKHIEAPD